MNGEHSKVESVSTDRRGVVIRQWIAPKPTETHVEPRWSEPYIVAMANRHKPWARRWLKQNRYRL